MPRPSLKSAVTTAALLCTSALVLSLPLVLSSTPAAADKEKVLSKSEVESIVKEYLAAHPETLVDSLKQYQVKQQAEAATKAQSALKDKKGEVFGDTSSPVAGNPKGDVTLVEFFDYHCGYCKKMVPDVTKLMSEDKNVRVVFKEFPILSPDSEMAAKAAIAVYRLQPAKYFEYHTALMKLNGKFDEAALTAEATKLGIDGDAFKKEMAKKEVADELAANRKLGMELGIQGTPGFIIGSAGSPGKLLPGAIPYDSLKQMVQEARKADDGKKDAPKS